MVLLFILHIRFAIGSRKWVYQSLTGHPPYSPDLNPIEHVWKKLKELVLEMHPEISDIIGEENIREALGKALQEAWDSIPKEYFDRLVESMPARVKAVIKQKG